MTREQAIAALTQIPIDLARKAIRRVCAVEGGDPGQGVRYEIDHAWAEKFWAVQDVLDAKAPVQVAAYLEILEALCHPAPSPDPECFADPDAANQAYDDLRRERDDLRRVGAEVVEAYRACREANSMSGFWTHLDDLAALLDGRADSVRATAPRPPSSPDPARPRYPIPGGLPTPEDPWVVGVVASTSTEWGCSKCGQDLALHQADLRCQVGDGEYTRSAPSPDPGERPDVAWVTQQRVNDLVYALDCIALHAAGEPTDPAEACRLIWKVADAARQPPAPSPAAAPPLGDEPPKTFHPAGQCGRTGGCRECWPSAPQPEKKEGTT